MVRVPMAWNGLNYLTWNSQHGATHPPKPKWLGTGTVTSSILKPLLGGTK